MSLVGVSIAMLWMMNTRQYSNAGHFTTFSNMGCVAVNSSKIKLEFS